MIDLKNYGFTDRYMIDSAIEGCIPARVTQVHREMYRVISTYGESNARLKGSFFNITETSQDFPAVGDFVHIKYNERGDSQIIKVYQRKSKFSRPDYSGHSAGYVKTILEQVVAANFDYIFILADYLLHNIIILYRVPQR